MGRIYTHQAGKANKKGNLYVRRMGGKDVSVERVEGYQYTRTETQRKARRSFGERSRRAAEWLRVNGDPRTAEYRRVYRAYKRQCKKDADRYATFWQYLVAKSITIQVEV